jgi:hypothetical protein
MICFAKELYGFFRYALIDHCSKDESRLRHLRWEDLLDERTKQAITEWRQAVDVAEEKRGAAATALDSFLEEHKDTFPLFEMFYTRSIGDVTQAMAAQDAKDCDGQYAFLRIPF